MPPTENLVLTKQEAALAEEIAKREGITVQQAAERILSGAFEHRVKKRTGKARAKVYTIKGRR